MPMGGLTRMTPAKVQDLNVGFFGAGCPHVGIEYLIAQVNKLLMHYNCHSFDRLALQTSLKYLTVELGASDQPLQESFVK